jgi:uncharacterized membrane protein YhiD involved in acid resistance
MKRLTTHWLVTTVIALGVGLMSIAVNAEVYQWRDANGKLHFSDKKPKQQDSEDISASVKAVNIDDSGEERAKLEQLFKPETAEEKALKQQKNAEKRQQQAQMKRRCEKAKKTLEILKGPVYFTRQDGSSYDVSVDEQARQVAKLEKKIRQNCR